MLPPVPAPAPTGWPMRTRRSAGEKQLREEELRNESIWNEKPLSTWKPASAWYPLDAPLRYADDLSCFVERLLLLRTRITAGVPFVTWLGCPVVRSKQYRG